jgi:hypothetical protein
MTSMLIDYKKRIALIFLAVSPLMGCATAPIINSCPIPPGEFMTPPASALPPLEGGSARQVYDALARDQEVYSLTAARLRSLQDWGRDWCGWATPAATPF